MRSFKLYSMFAAMLAVAPGLPAQNVVGAGGASKTVRIVRTDTPPNIDGRLDEGVWQRAAMIDDFHQIRPGDGTEPTERTEIYLLYDSDNLYVGGRLFDSEPELVTANIMRHNSALGQDDRLSVIIDPFNSGRNGYRFETNANGVRHDMLYKNINEVNRDWTVIWDTQSSIDEQGWVFEMAIPFKTLPFNPQTDTWGMNFARALRRRGEEMVWVSRNRSYNPSIVGHVNGFEGMEQGLGLDVVPSVSVSERRTFSPDESDTQTEPSLDVFYRITPSLNASLTVNTDFSATEVDDRQVNLTRFSLFFPEKRDFFLNDSDLFEFGRLGQGREPNLAATRPTLENGRPFFSRRLGLSAAGTEVDIEYGGKLSGRIGRWSIGTLAVRQDQFESIEASDVFVGRVAADVLGESSVSLMLTDGDPRSNLDNSLMGLDFQYLNTRLAGGGVLEGQAWYQQSDTEGLTDDDTAFGAGFKIPNAEGWQGGAAVKELEENFYPAVGFVDRTGIRDHTAQAGYTHILRDSDLLQKVFFGLDAQRIDSLGGGTQTEILLARLAEFESLAEGTFKIHYAANEEFVSEPFTIYEDSSREVVIPIGQYSFDDYSFEIQTAEQRRVAARFAYRSGDFYDGERVNVGGEFLWKPSRQFLFRMTYDWNDIDLPQGDFTTRVVQVVTELAFSMQLSWVNLVQYDNVSEVFGINSRLHWIPKAGQEGFIVLNHNAQDFDKDNTFKSSLSDLNVKFNYTFRF